MSFLTIANGSGLITGIPHTFNHFNVYTNRTGIGGLSVKIDGPLRCDVRYNDNHDGTVKVSYQPRMAGAYRIHVKYDGVPIIGSPFKVNVRGEEPKSYIPSTEKLYLKSSSKSSSKVKASGRGLLSALASIQNEIIVDTRDAAPGRLTWSIEGPGYVEYGKKVYNEGVYKLYYKPSKSGEYIVHIKYAEREINGSPFSVFVN